MRPGRLPGGQRRRQPVPGPAGKLHMLQQFLCTQAGLYSPAWQLKEGQKQYKEELHL